MTTRFGPRRQRLEWTGSDQALRFRARLSDRWLGAWFVGWFVVFAWHGGGSWHFFVIGQSALSRLHDGVGGGLHLYAALPQLQIGPVALVTAWLLSPFGSAVSLALAQVLGAAAGLVVLLLAHRLAVLTRPDLDLEELEIRARLAAVFFVPVWLQLAVGSTHLDDVLAILFAMVAMYATVRGRAVAAGVLVGLAIDSKPWAVPFAALLLLPSLGPRRWRAALASAGVVAVCWLPFLLGDPGTMRALRFTIVNTHVSALRVLGISAARTPFWDRPAQMVLGFGLAAVAVRRGRWSGVILVGVATRMLLDPGTNLYYTGGLVAGAAVWDIAGSRWRAPWWTATVAVVLFGARHLHGLAPLNGWAVITLFGFVVGLVVIAPRPYPRPGPGQRPPKRDRTRFRPPVDASVGDRDPEWH